MNSWQFPNPKGVILDIDDTLADTSATVGQNLWGKYPITKFQSHLDALKEWGMPELVPEWQESELFQSDMDPLLNNDAFLLSLPPIQEAHAGVQELVKKVPITCYLTSRLMTKAEITQEWLSRSEFPEAPVICREPEVMAKDWKLGFIQQYLPHTLAYIDNELLVPRNCRYQGRMIEIVRFKKFSPVHDGLELFSDWSALVASFT